MRLDKKVAIVTGGGAGLGRQSALLFAEEGASVVIADRNAQRADQVAAEITDKGGYAIGVETDVSSEDQVEAMVDRTMGTFGKLDILFCNAGIPAPRTAFEDQNVDEWRKVLDVNIIGYLTCIKYAIPRLRENGGGAILTCSSGAAISAVPGVPVYSATKGAINAMTRAFSLDLGADNIRVNVLCPMGGMSANFYRNPDDPLIDENTLYVDYKPEDSPGPLHRPNPPRLIDHARAALFLVSDEAAWVTGVELRTDGGMAVRPQVDVEGTIRAYETAKFVS
ncbi:SDR family oxidoreductase [Haloechinothrix sp. YIM 98757]|uniref:SDR family oxidoreductase n=1 Tax=Haloechinothrix aidingensis TaxID=2752311 RepID=A0A838ABY4_9PSEU|nr:SDR family oxidoreductase [Haloechinothrix aidingensis]MBA0126756.1 SDR family oxidoreductase [Haloechinothrix aidingensis]